MTDDTSGPTEGSTGRTSTAVWIVIAVLAALLVFTATLSLIEWRRASDLKQADSRRRTAAATAAQFGTALFTYDYNDMAAAKAKVLRLATPAYAKGYDASSAAEQATIVQLKARETAKASGVFLTDVVKDRAAAVVVLNSALQSASGNRSSVTYLDVALVRQGSAWKVDSARAVPIAS
jgi:Mce-associated membrane protein